MQRQFQQHTMEKTYLVRVQGQPAWQHYVCEAPLTTAPDVAGSRDIDEEEGQSARTDFVVLHRYADGTALLQASLHTGRTNQIRVHLWHLGFPVCGDPTYLPEKKVAATQTLDCDAAPMLLHAWRLSCDHPHSGKRLTFEDERPAWAVVPF
jgi:23S rRNA-/tRNA-specific pseudouridylate synthase